MLLLASCKPQREPGEFRVGIEGTPANLDPRYASDAHSVRIVPLLFNGLLKKTPSGGLEPDLAQTWETPTPLTHVLTLRQGVKFHDGSVLTGEDVAATYRFLMDPANGSPASGSLKALKAVEVEDLRVAFTLSEVYVSFPYQLTMGILPKRLAQKKDLGDELVGTGPFSLENMKSGEEITLAAFKDYFFGTPKLSKVKFRIVTNATTRLLEIRTGGLDLLQNAVPPYSVKFLEQEPNLRVIRSSGSSFQYMGFNMEDKILSDVRVRRAIAHAIDRKSLVEYVLDGQARLASALFPPEHMAYAPDAPTYEFSPSKAKQLLDEAGLTDPDGDGPLPRCALSYKTSTDKTAVENANVIADMLAKVGIKLEVRSFEWGAFFSDVKKGNFQLMSLRWVGLNDPDVLHYIFHSDSMPPAGANRGRYKNPLVDSLITQSRAQTDTSKRQALYRQIQEEVAKDEVYVSLWWADNIVIINSAFTGFVPLPGGEYTSLASVDHAR